jgi:predicted O-methyltransferase YrrM
MNLQEWLRSKGFTDFEGNSGQIPAQLATLKELSKDTKSVLEIGFNAGHSADIFLQNPNVEMVTSFDICAHTYVGAAKEYIDTTYPGRHLLIQGDSINSVNTYANAHKGPKYDLIFIDGCHEYDYATKDLENCLVLAHEKTIIVIDDTIVDKVEWVYQWNVGPTLAWLKAIQSNKIIPIKSVNYFPGRGMSWGQPRLS